MAHASTRDVFLTNAHLRMGKPFFEHFKPDDCQHGVITVDSCMEKGLGPNSYDCSGLIVASLAQTLKIRARDWPRDLRYSAQMEEIAR